MKINSDRVVAYVYETSDYSKFRKMEYNRIVSDSRFKKILASFSIKEILNPIIVNEKFEIIDGQGRFEVKKHLKRPIQYVVQRGADIEDCRRMNRYNEHWKAYDFVDSYAQAGNQNFINLQTACRESGYPITRVLRLANRGSGALKELAAGTFYFTSEDVTKVIVTAGFCKEILSALCFTRRPNEAFYAAVAVARDFSGYSQERMLKNCRNCRSTYTQMSSLKDELTELSRIYNYRTKRNNLYFEDYMRNRGASVRDYDTGTPFANQDIRTDVSTLK